MQVALCLNLYCTQNRERTNVSLVYFNRLAACTLVKRNARRTDFLLKQTKVTLVRSRFYAECRPAFKRHGATSNFASW